MKDIQTKSIGLTNNLIAREHKAILDTYYSMVQKIIKEGPKASIKEISIFYNEYLLEHIKNEEYFFERTEEVLDQKHLDDHHKITLLYQTAFGLDPSNDYQVNTDQIDIDSAYIFELAVTEHWQNFDSDH